MKHWIRGRRGFMLGALTYLEDVTASGCGAFYYWPGSHRPLQRFFHHNPGRLHDGCPLDPADPANPARGDAPLDSLVDTHGTWCTDVLDEHCPGGYSAQPREWLAPSGDLLLWHHWIVHSSTANAHGDRPRFALFGRWHHRQRASMRLNIAGIQEAEAVDGNEAETLWKNWTPEVRAVAAEMMGPPSAGQGDEAAALSSTAKL